MTEFDNNNLLNNVDNKANSDKANSENNAFDNTVSFDNENSADGNKLPEYSFIAEQINSDRQADTYQPAGNMNSHNNPDYQAEGNNTQGAYQSPGVNPSGNYQAQGDAGSGSYQPWPGSPASAYQPASGSSADYLPRPGNTGSAAPYQPQTGPAAAGYQAQGANPAAPYQPHGYNSTGSYQDQAYNPTSGYQPQANNPTGSYQHQANSPIGAYQPNTANPAADYQSHTGNTGSAAPYQPQTGPAAAGNQPQGANPTAPYQPQYYTDYPQQYNSTNTPYGNYYNQYNNDRNRKVKKERKPRFITGLLKLLVKAVCFGLIAGIGFFAFHKLYSVINPGASIQNVLNAIEAKDSGYQIAYTKPASITVSDKSVVTEVINNNLPSIVSITSVTTADNWFGQSYEVPGSGSGIIVGKTETEILVATNNHVVEGAQKITLVFVDGKEADGILKGADVAADLAVVAIDIKDISKETLEKITVAKLGNSDEVKVGEMAIAIGNALGYGQSATVGYISAKDREVEVSDGYFKTKKMILLQTDAAINPGNSGGALLNSKGEVIGINSVKYATEEVEGMGFAIPISSATPIINELMSREILSPDQQGFLGISGGDVTEDAATAYNMPVGVFVNEVVENGPAYKAGLLSGDIIIKVDEIKVTAITQLREYVNSRRVGTEVKVTYMRYDNGTYKENTVTVTLGKNPNLAE